MRVVAAAGPVLLLWATACGSSGPSTPEYPAPHTPLPLLVDTGGPILTSPQIVTVTFQGEDPSFQESLEAFGAAITASGWWSAVATEYGIGKGSAVAAHLDLTPQPTYTDSTQGAASTIALLVQQSVASGALPAPTPETLYVIYFPTGVSFTIDGMGQSCTEIGGYHLSTQVTPPGGAMLTVPYAVIPRCPDPATNAVSVSHTTVAASHEIIEASTNVTPLGTRGWAMPVTSAWGATQPEPADMCGNDELGAQIAFQRYVTTDAYTEGQFTYQRSWSNASAKAGHNPCVPIPAGDVYYNTAARVDAVQIAVGSSATLPIDGFSEGPLAPWTLQAFDLGEAIGLGQTLEFSLDRTTLSNGETAHLTVTLTSAPPGPVGQQETIFWIISQGQTDAHIWPVVVLAK